MSAALKMWSSINDDGDLEGYFEEFQRERAAAYDDVYDDEEQGPASEFTVSSPEFLEWLNSAGESAIWDAWGRFQHLFSDAGTCRVYRAITAPADWQPEPGRHPGIYWSWSKENAQAHWGEYSDGHVDWLMTADITVNDVDWPITLAMNASRSYEEECEIRVKDDTHVHVLSVERPKGPLLTNLVLIAPDDLRDSRCEALHPIVDGLGLEAFLKPLSPLVARG